MFPLFKQLLGELFSKQAGVPVPTPEPECLVDFHPQPVALVSFNLQRVLAGIMLHQSAGIDVHYPNETDEDRVLDTHIGPLTSNLSKTIAAALIASSQAFQLDLSFLVALTYVNARWSPETYDHCLRNGAAGFSFDQTRWGIGLFYGSELKKRDEFRFHTEGYIAERTADPAWSIDAIARELDAHVAWAQELEDAYTMVMVSKVLTDHQALEDITSEEKWLWLAALAFYLRDRHKAIELVWSASNTDVAPVNYCSAIIELTRKFRPQLTELQE